MYCAGALAEIYEQMGGREDLARQTLLPIYDTAAAHRQQLTDVDTNQAFWP